MIFVAPEKIEVPKDKIKIFLGGTIDSGDSEDWQSIIANNLSHNFVIYNPRRAKWPKDSDVKEVEKQIRWEHEALDSSDLIIMNILPNSKSPISLMEIGMYAQSGKLVVYCTKEFYRFTNVKMVCEKYDIPLYETNDIDDILFSCKNHIYF